MKSTSYMQKKNNKHYYTYSSLFKLSETIMLNCDHPEIYLKNICGLTGATSATLWCNNKTSLSTKKFVLIGYYNRSDLAGKINNMFLDTKKDNVVASVALNRNRIIRGKFGERPFDKNWLQKDYTRKLPNLGIQYIAIIPILDRFEQPVRILSLYFDKAPRNLPNDILFGIAGIIRATIEAIDETLRASRLERRKDRHEIMYHTRIISSKFDKIVQDITKLKSDENNYERVSRRANDISSSVRVLRQSYKSSSFKERVSDRFRNKEAIYLKKAVVDIISKTINVLKSPNELTSGEINIPNNMKINFHPDDLDMLLTQFYSNTVKYSIPGGVVQTKIEKSGKYRKSYILTISNDIPKDREDNLNDIWKYEKRGDFASRENIEGEGLGLGMAKDICDAYGIRKNATYEEHSSKKHTKIFKIMLELPIVLISEDSDEFNKYE
ncbi:hypothetical protein NBRC116602_17190 [Hyphomicrobiales bacterium 4NK60-0047b]